MPSLRQRLEDAHARQRATRELQASDIEWRPVHAIEREMQLDGLRAVVTAHRGHPATEALIEEVRRLQRWLRYRSAEVEGQRQALARARDAQREYRRTYRKEQS